MSEFVFDPNLVKTIYNRYGCDYYVKNLRERGSEALLIVGPGRVGKDTLAAAITRLTALRYNGTCSLAAAELVWQCYKEVYNSQINFRHFYMSRHDHRDFFFHCLNAFRDYEPLVVPAMALQDSDLLVGVRSKRELEAASPYVKSCVWVNREGTPNDNTLEFNYADCVELFGRNCLMFNNNDSLPNLVRATTWLLDQLNIDISLSPKEIPYCHTNGLVIGQ